MMSTRYIGDLITHAADRQPDKTAVCHGQKSISYEEIYTRSWQLANALIASGIRKGDRVCFYLEKRIEKVISIFGITLSGAVFVPIRRLARARQAVHIINDCGARLLITTGQKCTELFLEQPLMSKLISVYVIGTYTGAESPGTDFISWEDINTNHTNYFPSLLISETDPAAILYTSGSTGRPKGVVLNHQNIIAGARKVSDYLKICENDRLLSILTFGFDYGLNQLTTAFLKNAQIVLLDYLFPKDILRAVERYNITGLAAVATTWIQLLQISWEQYSLDGLRYITNSGGAIPVQKVKELKKRLPNTAVYLMYGLTEAFRSTYLDPSLVDDYPASIGKAIPGEEIMVLGPDDRPVQPGQIGELVHRGVLVSQGYWGDPELTENRFKPHPLQEPNIPIREMVVYSGDYVRLESNGLMYFVGRKDEMIKCAGNRISPTEVEEIIYAFDGVADTVVFGIPHETYGQQIVAVVALSSDNENNPETLHRYCVQKMPAYMVPSQIVIEDSLPKNENGKIDRSAIKHAYFAQHGLLAH